MKKIAYISFFALLLLSVVVYIFVSKPLDGDKRETLIITMLDNGYIRNIETNIYKLWLEEQTGYKLIFNLVPPSYSKEYLEQLFSSETVKTDILFLSDGNGGSLLNNEQIKVFAEKKMILPLNQYIENATYLKKILDGFTEYDLEGAITSEDGNIYYVPALDVSRSAKNGQVLWLNTDWLKAVKMTIPKTTDDLFLF